MGIIISVLMLLITGSLSGTEPGYSLNFQKSGNLALNSDFSEGENSKPAFWYPLTLNGEGEAIYSWVDEGIKGTKCLKLESDNLDGKYSWAQTSIKVKPGTFLTIKGKVKLRDLKTKSGHGFMIVTHFFGPCGYVDWAFSNGTMKSDNQWHDFSHRIKVLKGASHARVSLRLAKTQGTMWLDDIKILGEEVNSENLSVPLPCPKNPVLKVGLIADITSSPVYQFADHLARYRIETKWLDPQSLESGNLQQLFSDIDVLMIINNCQHSETGSYNTRMIQEVQNFVKLGKGIAVIGLEGWPEKLNNLLPVDYSGCKFHSHCFHPKISDDCKIQWLKNFPVFWPVFPGYWEGKLKTNAQAVLVAKVDDKTVPILVLSEGLPGRIAYFNSQWDNKEFLQWRYSPLFMSQLISWLAKKDPTKITSYGKIPGMKEYLKYLSFAKSFFGFTGPLNKTDKPSAKIPEISASLDLSGKRNCLSEWKTVGDPQPVVHEQPNKEWLISFGNDLFLKIRKNGFFQMGIKNRVVVSSDRHQPFPRMGVVSAKISQKTDLIDVDNAEPQIAYSKPVFLANQVRVEEIKVKNEKLIIKLLLSMKGTQKGIVEWHICRKDLNLGNNTFLGFAFDLKIDIPNQRISDIAMPWTVSLENPVTPYRLAAYSNPRGPFVKKIQTPEDLPKHNVWYYHSGGQPFHFMSSENGGVISFFSEPVLVRAEICPGNDKNNIIFDQLIKVGAVPSEKLKIPTMFLLFSPSEIGPNQWLDFTWFLTKEYCGQLGMNYELPLPTMQARYDKVKKIVNEIMPGANTDFNFQKYAQIIAPIVKEDFFRKVEAGYIINLEVTDEELWKRGGKEGIKNLTRTLKEAGADTHSYWRITYWNRNVKELKNNSDYFVRDKNGKPKIGLGLVNCSMKSGYRQLAEKKLADYMKLGIKGVWYDSLAPAVGAIDYSRPDPSPQLPDVYSHFATMRKQGLSFWVEGMSPVAINSHWFRYANYGNTYRNHHYMLFRDSLYASHWDTVLFLDYFKAASFLGLPMVDFDVVIYRNSPLTKWIREVNKKYLNALDSIGQFSDLDLYDFGTVWRGTKGYAVFAHKPVSLTINGLNENTKLSLAGLKNSPVSVKKHNPTIELNKEDVLLIH